MRIKVEIKNDILGDSVFWEDDSKNIQEIKNIPARQAAEHIIKYGSTKGSLAKITTGMWVVSEVKR